MTDPIALFDELREMYLRYLDSPFDLRYPELVTERRALLNADGRIFRQPLIEPVPAYQSGNRTFQAMAQALRIRFASRAPREQAHRDLG